MLLEIAIIIGSISGGLTAISLAALSFVKKQNSNEFALRKQELEIEKADQEQELKERDIKIQREEEEYRKKNPPPPPPPKAPSREELLPIFEIDSIKMICPFCGEDSSDYADPYLPNGYECHGIVYNYGIQELMETSWEDGTVKGPSTVYAIMVGSKTMLWQCCISCGAEWLLDKISATQKKKSK